MQKSEWGAYFPGKAMIMRLYNVGKKALVEKTDDIIGWEAFSKNT